jgi:hypothetical protein
MNGDIPSQAAIDIDVPAVLQRFDMLRAGLDYSYPL